MSKNDDKILQLKQEIEKKKVELSKNRTRFMPVTNCILTIGETIYNLNAMTDEMLIVLMIRLNVYIMSANDLGIEIPLFSGYHINDWIEDTKNKLKVSDIKKKESELKKMESKLDKLLSEDKKTELEINEIEELLK